MLIVSLTLSFHACKSNKPVVQTSGDYPLVGTRWELVELNGKSIPAENNSYFLLQNDGSISGNLGCNTFSGHYTTQEGNRIRFSELINTQKMCLDMTIETELSRILQTADSYSIRAHQLVLYRARMAPLARFEWKKPR